MIEVNLLPGGKKKSGGGGRFSLSLPKFSGGLSGFSIPKRDGWTLGAGVAVVIALLAALWLYSGVSGVADELQVQIDGAVSDSSRYAGIIERSSTLQARRDSIAARVAVIQEIDQRRYVWPHLMDEVARALPEYTWLTRLTQVVEAERVSFQVEGRAGTTFAMTTFMENLEASPFVEAVTLVSSAQVPVGSGTPGLLVYEFVFDAIESNPPPEILQTVPLFDPMMVDPAALSPAAGGG